VLESGSFLCRAQAGPSLSSTFRKSRASQMVKHWNRLPREVLKSPSLEVLKKCVDVALQDMV